MEQRERKPAAPPGSAESHNFQGRLGDNVPATVSSHPKGSDVSTKIKGLGVPASVARSPATSAAEALPAAKASVVPAKSPRMEDAFVGAQAPGLAPRPASVNNNFRLILTGTHPAVEGGGFFAQLRQASHSLSLQGYAGTSVATGGRLPPDFAVEAKLRSLSLTPVSSGPKSVIDYTSTIPNTSAQKLYERFVANPSEVFGAGGLTLRPAAPLTQGARVMIEDKGPPPMWMPVEARLDPARHEITFHTLDGHPLRGTNSFRFTDDGQGGARIEQHSVFQYSSLPARLGGGLFDGSGRQHKTWESVHAHLFRAMSTAGAVE
jgi:hypothetical protein